MSGRRRRRITRAKEKQQHLRKNSRSINAQIFSGSAMCTFANTDGGKKIQISDEASTHCQALPFVRQTLTSPSGSVMCLSEIYPGLLLSNTRHRSTVKSASVSSHSNRMFCPAAGQQYLVVDRGL